MWGVGRTQTSPSQNQILQGKRAPTKAALSSRGSLQSPLRQATQHRSSQGQNRQVRPSNTRRNRAARSCSAPLEDRRGEQASDLIATATDCVMPPCPASDTWSIFTTLESRVPY